jgi:exodeoxyribonuclease V beta subunit
MAGAASAQVQPAVPLPVPRTLLLARGDAAPLQDAPVYTARFARDWGIASFSALVRDLAAPQHAPSTAHLLADAAVQEELLAEAGEDSDDAPAPAPAIAPWHTFARGAYAGNFLHELLEWLADHGFALAGDPALQQALLRRCERNGWGNRADAVLAWLLALVDTPLPPLGVPLSGLGTLLPEMEFWFASPRTTQARRIDQLCRRHLLEGRDRPTLPERELRGMLMGFADLVFESGGRYWVLDYKSNALGDSDAHYHADAMQSAMAQHRYDVQAALYLLALHRLLRLRLGDNYDPARHLGGAVYLFMRGLRGPEAGCVLIEPDVALLDALDRVLAGRPAAEDDVIADGEFGGAARRQTPSKPAGQGAVS